MDIQDLKSVRQASNISAGINIIILMALGYSIKNSGTDESIAALYLAGVLLVFNIIVQFLISETAAQGLNKKD